MPTREVKWLENIREEKSLPSAFLDSVAGAMHIELAKDRLTGKEDLSNVHVRGLTEMK